MNLILNQPSLAKEYIELSQSAFRTIEMVKPDQNFYISLLLKSEGFHYYHYFTGFIHKFFESFKEHCEFDISLSVQDYIRVIKIASFKMYEEL